MRCQSLCTSGCVRLLAASILESLGYTLVYYSELSQTMDSDLQLQVTEVRFNLHV